VRIQDRTILSLYSSAQFLLDLKVQESIGSQHKKNIQNFFLI